MAHKKPMKNVRVDLPLVARAEAMKMHRVADAGLEESAGTWSYSWPSGPGNRFRSTTKVLAAALEIGLAELEKRFAASEKEAEAKRHQLTLRHLGG